MTSANNQQFSFTMDHLLEGCQIIGFDWTYLYLNKSAEIHNRRPNSELIGRQYQDMWPGVEQTEVFRLIKNALEQRTASHFENEFQFPDGKKGWFVLSIQPVPEGVFILSIDITVQKNAELALTENIEKYQLIADHSEDLIYWISPDRTLQYISPSCLPITGYSDTEFMNNPMLFASIIHPAEKNKLLKHAIEAGQEDYAHSIEFRIVNKKGETRWMNHTCKPMFNERGEFIGRRAKNHDITELKSKEEQLTESEIRFNKLFFESPFGMVLVNSDFSFRTLNPAFLTMLGYEENELLGKTFNEITHPDDKGKDTNHVLKLIRKEIPVLKIDKRYIRKNGEVMWATLTVVANYDNDGKFKYNLAIIEDITARKQAEEELRLSEERYRSIFLNSQSVMLIIDPESGRIIDANESACKYYGWSYSELCLKNVSEVNISPQSVIAGNLSKAAEKSEHFFNVKHRIADGSVRDVEVYSGPVTFGNEHYLFSVIHDVTERKLAEQTLRISEERYRNIFESAIIGVYRTSPDGRILMANPTMVSMLGYDSFEELAQRNLETEAKNGNYKRDLFIQKIDHEGAIFGFESEWKTKEGKPIIVRENARAFYDDEGHVLYYEGTIEDITERRLTENALMESEEKFRKAFDINPDAITITRISDGVYFSVNKGFLLTFGYTEEEVIGKSSVELHIWSDPDQRKQFIEKISQKNGVENYEAKLCTKNGRIRDMLVSSTVIEINKVPYILSTSKDITELKLARESLEKNMLLLNEVGQIAKIGGWEFSPITGESEWTEEVARIHGLDPGAPSSVEISLGCYPSHAKAIIDEALDELLQNGKPYDLELEFKATDGIEKWIRTIGKPVYDNGKIVKIHGSIQDITEKKQAEVAIKQSEALLNQAQEIGKMGSWSINMKAGTLNWSENMYRLLGMEPYSVEPTFELYLNLVHPDDRHLQDFYLLQIMQTKQEVNYDFRYILQSGEIIWVQNNISPVFENDLLIELYGTNIDITEIKKTEQELIRAKEHAEASDRLKSEFLNNISHEIRTPLNGILGFASLATDQNISPANREMYSNLLQKSSDRLIKTITDIIDLSMIISGSQSIQKEYFDVIDLLQQVSAEFEKEFEQKKRHFVFNNLTGQPTLMIDSDITLLHKVLSQLMDNAVKFTDAGEIRLTCQIKDQELTIEVKDTGVGIADSIKKQVFGVFMQEDSSNTRKFEGSGNGLSIANGFIQLLGGKIWFDSEAGKGSTFFVSLPYNHGK